MQKDDRPAAHGPVGNRFPVGEVTLAPKLHDTHPRTLTTGRSRFRPSPSRSAYSACGMPDVQDAIKVVTHPANLVGAGDRHTGERAVNEARAVRALREQGAGKAEARALIREAAQELGGRVDSEVRFAGRATGPDTKTAVEIWYVPTAAIRSS